MLINSIRLPHLNNAAESKTVKLETPPSVIVSLSQNIGAPCEAVVKIGDEVKTGQLIGDSSELLSAPIHSGITGTVADIINITSINGRINKALVIEAADRQFMSDDIKPPIISSREDFINAVRQSGSVGLGGAGFPTHMKFRYDRSKIKVDTLIINGAECEPYITSDYREIMENTRDIVKGIKLVTEYLDIENTIIGIEKNKPNAISQMRKELVGENKITVLPLKTSYPQGAEKVLIYKTTGRVIKEGEFPMSAGCLVLNSSTTAFIARYIATGIPLIQRRITVDGNIVNKPSNLLVPVGTKLSEIMKHANLRYQPDRVIFGGPMMGNCVYDLNTPVNKTTSSVLFFNNSTVHEESVCIRCGKCIGACPMNLMPVLLEKAYNERNAAKLTKLKINTCLGCGSCSYVCTAKRSLAERNSLAKDFLRGN